MLIDWLTIRVPYEKLNQKALETALCYGDRIQRICAATGEQVWESAAWDSIRSDSHAITVKAGGLDFWIQGSPARVIGDGDAVFGEGASHHLDIAGCIDRMRLFAGHHLNCELPDPDHWIVSRADITENIRLDSLADVRVALATLRNCEGGRYRVSQQAGDTVYWGGRSKHRRGKAYAKGPHLKHMTGKPKYDGHPYTEQQIEQANRLLRLELTLGREWFARHDWREVKPDELKAEWCDYFGRMIGDAEMKTDADIKDRVYAAAPTEGRAKAALGCWALIQSQGWEAARELQSRPTWYRNLQILRKAGLGDADISIGKVVPIRSKIIECQSVTSWAELARLA